MKKLLFGFGLLVLMSACTTLHPSVKKPIVIGGISALSGGASSYGIVSRNAAQLRAEQWNEIGGIDGRLLEIMWHDGECSQEVSREAARELVKEEHVKIIFGGSCSDETIGAAAITEPSKILLLSPLSSSPEISQMGEYIYRTMASDAQQGKIMAQHIEQNKIAKVVVLIEETAYTQGLLNVFMDEYDGLVKTVSLLPNEEKAIGVAIARSKELGADEILVLTQSMELAYNVIDNLEKQNWTGGVIANSAFASYLAIANDFQKYLKENNVLSTEYMMDDSKRKEMAHFAEQYNERFGEEMGYENQVAATLDAVDILVEVLSNVDNSNDTNALREAFNTIQHIGYLGTITFDVNGDPRTNYTLMEFNEGQFVPTED